MIVGDMETVTLTIDGQPVTVEKGKTVLQAAIRHAEAIAVPVSVAVLDDAAHLIAFERMDAARRGTVAVAQQKAATAALFERPTAAFDEMVQA